MTTPVHITLHAKDGYQLAATHYVAPGEQFIVMANATGVPRGFYKRFAEFAQARGVKSLSPLTTVALAIQNRRRSKALTCSTPTGQRSIWLAAIDYAVKRGRVWLVGHSLGGSCDGSVAQPQYLGRQAIDVHTHDDCLLLHTPQGAHPKLSQGVTTVITGNCGISLAPLITQSPPAPLDLLGTSDWRFKNFAEYLDALEQAEPIVNAACLVGHSTLRVKHLQALSRAATPHECARMADELALALQAGAIGLSTGLYYPPAQSATAEELIAVGAPLQAAGGMVAMHIRDEGDAITAALREALHIGNALGITTVLSHHKLVGTANHGRSIETLKMIEAAAQNQSVCMDCYPYNASSTMLLPARVQQSSDVLVTWSKTEPRAAGRSLFDLAHERNQAPEDVAKALQPAGAIYFAMDEADVSRIMAHPLTMIGSDGLAHDVQPHPRLWGTFPRVLGRYVREQRLLSLELAIHKMTGLSARRFGLNGRGVLAVGNFADVVIFDEHQVTDRASYQQPTQVSTGIDAVYVNGVLACEQGHTAHSHAGRVLRRV